MQTSDGVFSQNHFRPSWSHCCEANVLLCISLMIVQTDYCDAVRTRWTMIGTLMQQVRKTEQRVKMTDFEGELLLLPKQCLTQKDGKKTVAFNKPIKHLWRLWSYCIELERQCKYAFAYKNKKDVVVCIIKPIWQVVIKREVLQSHVWRV